jgi:uncharacterized small protein (DUF1192 family)
MATIDSDDLARPRPGQRFTPPASLEGWSLDDLRTYIVALSAEIARAEAAIADRRNQRDAADAVFRRRDADS